MSAQTPITRLMKRLESSRKRQAHTLVRVSPYSDRSIWHVRDASKQAQKGDLVCKVIGCTGRAKVIDGLARVTAPHNCTLWVPYAQTVMSSLQGRENLPRYLAEMAPMDSNLQIILAKAFYADNGKYDAVAFIAANYQLPGRGLFNIEWHGTAPLTIDKFATEGLQWRNVDIVNARRHGNGVYTTPHAYNACHFARDLDGKVLGPGGMGIIAAVAVKHGKFNRKQVTFTNGRKFFDEFEVIGNFRIPKQIAPQSREANAPMCQSSWIDERLVHVLGYVVVRKMK